MILDKIENASLYYPLHARFQKAFEFLKKRDLEKYEVGRYDIDGDNIFALISEPCGKGKENADLEFHEKYIDIQVCLKGTDCIGWKDKSDCLKIKKEFDSDKDTGFFSDKPQTWIYLSDRIFAIFFPHDAHAPLATQEELRKVVIKVRKES